jgi:predicted anti-sigma-YlaC factor YlaD
MDALLKAAPGGEAGAAAMSQLGTMAAAAGMFKKLGLSPAMVAQFVPLLTKFVGVKGGPEVAKLLAGVFK